MRTRNPYPLPVWAIWTLVLPLALVVLGAVAVASIDVEDLVLERPDLWWLGAAVPFCGSLCLLGAIRRRKLLARFAHLRVASLLASGLSSSRQAFRAGLIVLGVTLIVAAIIGPRFGTYLDKQVVHGVDVVVAVDVSRSMLASDLRPTRLEYAKTKLRQQLTERSVFRRAHRLGLIAFAGTTSLRLPLTTDHVAFRNKLDQLDTSTVPRGGTATAEAIQRSIDLFARSPEEATKILILVTDGENHEGDPIALAQTAWNEHGIRVFTVGVGDTSSSTGARVPEAPDSSRPLLHDGQIVFSKVDVGAMRQIASAGGGEYVGIENLFALVNSLAEMKRAELTVDERLRHRPQYQWFIAAAILALALEALLGDRAGTRNQHVERVWQQEFAE